MSDRHIIVETQGITPIVDGREFVIDEYYGDPYGRLEGLGIPTKDNGPFIVYLAGRKRPRLTLPIDEASPMSCGICDDVFVRDLMTHNLRWMYSVLSCRQHPEDMAVIDVFPKKIPGPEYDWANALLGLSTPRPPEGIIRNATDLEEEVRWAKAAATARVILRPDVMEYSEIKRAE